MSDWRKYSCRQRIFYPATVLTKVTKKMPVFLEEIFGPVAPIISAKNEEEAISIAIENSSKKLSAGICVINDSVKSDSRFPFGRINESGYGRELSYHGMREFVNIKTVYAQ